jgi:nucleotide-binding universal stress UspA family protein
MSTTVALVAGYDRHPAARAALDTAIALAAELKAELHVVHSSTLDDFGIDPDCDQFEAEHARALADERAEVTRLLGDSGLVWTYHEKHGDPSQALAELADRVDARMIVVGATHAGRIRHALGGESVAKRLLRCQQRPLLVVPEPKN